MRVIEGAAIMKFLLRTAATLALLITASTAQATWQLATSTHFAVYVDGSEATARDAAERLEKFPIRLTQLAHGLPVGGELDYLDEGTLAQALRARRPMG